MLNDKEKATLRKNFWRDAQLCFGHPLRPCPPQLVCLYALEMSDGSVKIGVTKNLDKRIGNVKRSVYLDVLRTHQTALAPRRFIFSLEKICHAAFEARRVRGEFFNITFEEAQAELDRHAQSIADALHAADQKYIDVLDFYFNEFLPEYEAKHADRELVPTLPPADNLPQVVVVEGVRGYVDDEGTVHLNAEDVARGLGFVIVRAERVTTSGINYVRWERVNEYLAEFDCPPVARGDFIPENMFYLLAMKANNETAKAFQWKVANNILPSIRKQGFYVADDAPAHVRANLSLKSKEVALLKNQLPAEKMIDFAVVYMLLMSNGSVKIGMTANLTERARQIKAESGLGVLDYVSTPFIAREDAVRLEESLKQRFNDKCLGGEFFAIRFYDSRCLLNSPTSLTPAELARAF